MRDTRNQQPMAGVEVRLDGPSGLRKTKSGSNGRFALENLVPGKYTLYYRAPHHRSELPMMIVLEAGSGQHVEVPIYFPHPADTACCMPYGAPPARRRVV